MSPPDADGDAPITADRTPTQKEAGQADPNGTPCGTGADCRSGFCTDGLCCESACLGLCRACNLTGSRGMCVPVLTGADPDDECTAQPTTTCGFDGTCDGAGACRLYLPVVPCGPSRCAGTSSQVADLCDGTGVCRATAAATTCGMNLCTAGACATPCPTGACPAKFRCEAGACVPEGLLLYWNLDEADGAATATDTSGHGYHGTFTGAVGQPVAATDATPGLQFPNPRSRAFTMANSHAIQLAPMPPALKRVNDLTISIHLRATMIDSADQSALVSLGDSIGLHLGPQDLNLFKHVAGPEFVNLTVVTATVLDGKWHHVVAVIGTDGMRIFFDGEDKGNNPDGRPVIYILGTDLWVGRHGAGRVDVNFGGNIDDVRIYDRVLSAQEIAELSRGAHAP